MAHSRETRLPADSFARFASVVPGLAGIGVVLLFPGNLPVAAAAVQTVVGLWLLTGIAAARIK